MSGVAADNEEVELDVLLLDSVGPGAATADGPSKARSPAATALTHPQTSAAAAQAAAPAQQPGKRTTRAQVRMDLQLR